MNRCARICRLGLRLEHSSLLRPSPAGKGRDENSPKPVSCLEPLNRAINLLLQMQQKVDGERGTIHGEPPRSFKRASGPGTGSRPCWPQRVRSERAYSIPPPTRDQTAAACKAAIHADGSGKGRRQQDRAQHSMVSRRSRKKLRCALHQTHQKNSLAVSLGFGH